MCDDMEGSLLLSTCPCAVLTPCPVPPNPSQVRALLVEAAARGYAVMVLDTLERLEGANRLYCRLGFEVGRAAHRSWAVFLPVPSCCGAGAARPALLLLTS